MKTDGQLLLSDFKSFRKSEAPISTLVNMAVEPLDPKLPRTFSKYFHLVCFYIVFVTICSRPALSFSTITSLPGFSASLPFKLETGYIAVGDVEFFFYFIESERDPAEDPVFLWLNGGPGCSALSGLFFEIGPLQFIMVEYNGSLPTFALNPYSWTKVASIIFLDAPVGTGFSYSRTSQGFKTGDKKYADDGYNFLRKWLHSHPKFITNPLYVGGDSYSGRIVPIIAKAISDGIEDRSVPAINLKGYLLGNPGTDSKFDDNSKIPFYHRVALISDELFESAKRNCKEEYVEVNISNVDCAKDLQTISECTVQTNHTSWSLSALLTLRDWIVWKIIGNISWKHMKTTCVWQLNSLNSDVATTIVTFARFGQPTSVSRKHSMSDREQSGSG